MSCIVSVFNVLCSLNHKSYIIFSHRSSLKWRRSRMFFRVILVHQRRANLVISQRIRQTFIFKHWLKPYLFLGDANPALSLCLELIIFQSTLLNCNRANMSDNTLCSTSVSMHYFSMFLLTQIHLFPFASFLLEQLHKFIFSLYHICFVLVNKDWSHNHFIKSLKIHHACILFLRFAFENVLWFGHLWFSDIIFSFYNQIRMKKFFMLAIGNWFRTS